MPVIRCENKHLSFNNIFYVDTINGKDTNDGTESNPFASMTKAVSKAAQNDDAIYLKGVDNASLNYGTKTISIFGNYLAYGSKLTGRQSGGGTTTLANITYYGLYIYGAGTVGWSEDLLYMNAILHNCLFFDGSPFANVYGSYKYYNCLILGIGAPYSPTSFINCAFKYNLVDTSINCLSNVTFDILYRLTSSGWQNTGIGDNGAKTNIGLYGGTYKCWENPFAEYRTLIPPVSNNYIPGTYSVLTKSILNTDIILYSIGFICNRTPGAKGMASARIYDENFQLIGKGVATNINSNSFTYSQFDTPITLFKNTTYYIGVYGYNFAAYSDGLSILSDDKITIYCRSTTYSIYDSYGTNESLQAEMSFVYNIIYKDIDFNFNHYSIKTDNKYYILNKEHYDADKDEFIEIPLPELYNFENTLDYYNTNIEDIYTPFVINDKIIYPFYYIKPNSTIVKIIGFSYSHTTLNKLYSDITFKTDFITTSSTLIKLNDAIKLPLQELKYFISSNIKTPIKVGLICNSYIYGENFEVIKEEDIKTNGIDLCELDKLEIPFDNVRFMFCFTRNIGTDDDELKYFKIIINNNNLRKLLNYNEYTLISKQDDNNIHIIVNNAAKTLVINKLEKENIEYRVKDTLNTF